CADEPAPAARNPQSFASDTADHLKGNTVLPADHSDGALGAGREGNESTASGLAEEKSRGTRPRLELDRGAEVRLHCALRKSDGQAAVGDVVGRGEEPSVRESDQQIDQAALCVEIHFGAGSLVAATDRPEKLTAAELVSRFAEKSNHIALAPERDAHS